MKKKLLAFMGNPILSAAVLTAIVSGVANAQVPATPEAITTFKGLGLGLFCPIINAMFWVLISVSIIMVLYAAYLYVIAADDAAKPSQARKMILYAAIGIVIALLAKGAPNIIAGLFPAVDISSNPLSCL